MDFIFREVRPRIVFAKTIIMLQHFFHASPNPRACHHIYNYSCIIWNSDRGSCKNVMSEEAPNKLHLSIEKHPTPYRLSWVKKRNGVIIHPWCLVSFPISNTFLKCVVLCGPQNGCMPHIIESADSNSNLTEKPFTMGTKIHTLSRKTKTKLCSNSCINGCCPYQLQKMEMSTY